ncbi:MAG: DUF465 domain-containing protein [Bacteroidota bacterium]|nr:DUF465 domain-containing protein [Bacteroidota bacterium]
MQKHDLLHEFPEMKEKIHELKTSDTHFRKFFDEYHEVDHEIHSIETGATPTTDEHLNELRIKRVNLKDSIYEYLKK